MTSIPTLRWEGGPDGHLVLLDQTRLPGEIVELHCRTIQDVWLAIKQLVLCHSQKFGLVERG